MAESNLIHEYFTLEHDGVGEFKDRGSKFLAYAYHVTTTDEVEMRLDELRKSHLKARHHCYAYILDRYQEAYRANDDGEPSGTAGKPILGQLHSTQIVEALVVVVRYFGGTKLGTSGLINAYRTAAQLAIADAGKRLVRLSDTIQLTVSYATMGHVLDCIKGLEIEITDKVFLEDAVITITIPTLIASDRLIELQARILQVSTEQITDKTVIEGCTLQILQSYA